MEMQQINKKEQRLATLTFKFFISKGLTDNANLMRAQLLILECMNDNASVESVKKSFGYQTCLNDLPNEMLSDDYIKQIIEFKL